jgi:uncharacterized membrane protein
MRNLKITTSRWSHPAVRSRDELTLGERAADRVRNGMGSWGFVGIALAFLAAWMVFNGRHGFDPFPFILLNLLLSCLAAMQGAILLIAAKRTDQISAALAQHDFDTNVEADAIIKQVHQLVLEIHRHAVGAAGGVDPGSVAGDDGRPSNG